jgi:chemotaxis family two-component system response regulator Rcp1
VGKLKVVRENVLLYVEDEDAAVFLLETALKEASIPAQLWRVSNGEEALAFLRKIGVYERAPKPDLILLDLNLPRKTGFEVLSEVQHEKDLRDISVIVFTSSSLPADRKKSLALGARRFITKPSSFDGFIESVREACSSFRSGGDSQYG